VGGAVRADDGFPPGVHGQAALGHGRSVTHCAIDDDATGACLGGRRRQDLTPHGGTHRLGAGQEHQAIG
jgi:hypothetical protein